MNRFLCPNPHPWKSGDTVMLPPDESRHAVKVLRLSSGDHIEILNGHGCRAISRISHSHPTHTQVIVQSAQQQPPPKITIHLVQAIIKNKAMDQLLQKTVEAGVHHIHPIITHHTEARIQPGSSDAQDKSSKWIKTLHEAQKQSGNAWTPILHPIQNFSSTLDQLPTNHSHLVASLQPNSIPILNTFPTLPHTWIWIGPEGDFSPDEYQKLQKKAIQPVTLGPFTLRSETAACVAVALLSLQSLTPQT